MSEELNLRQAAERLIYWCGRIEHASTEAEENECCAERDKLFAVFRKADAMLAAAKPVQEDPDPPYTMKSLNQPKMQK